MEEKYRANVDFHRVAILASSPAATLKPSRTVPKESS
nr:MAG TPA: hypothetical protein [Caudoviricetes sp.]